MIAVFINNLLCHSPGYLPGPGLDSTSPHINKSIRITDTASDVSVSRRACVTSTEYLKKSLILVSAVFPSPVLELSILSIFSKLDRPRCQSSKCKPAKMKNKKK